MNPYGDGDAARLAAAIHVLLRVFTVNERAFPSAEGRMRYNPLDFQTIGAVAARPGLRGADLARHLGVVPTTAQSCIDRLARRGLIAKGPGGRGLRLTTEGEAVAAAIRRQDVSNMTRMLAVLPPERRGPLIADIEAIAAAMEAEAEGAA